MTDLPGPVRERLAEPLLPTLFTEVRDVDCDDGATRKTLWRAHDGTLVESVLMRYPTAPPSASPARPAAAWPARSAPPGQGGLTRNLSTAEIVEQVQVGRPRGEAAGRRAVSATSSSWAWASRWPTTTGSSPPYAD